MESLQFRPVGEIPVFTDGYSLVARGVANDGALLFLYVEASGVAAVMERYKDGAGTFARPRMQEPKKFRVVRMLTGLLQVIELPELDVTFPKFDVFPDGSVLVAASRAEWRAKDDFDRNGIVFNPATNEMIRILLGDGINHVSVDALGRIWVAYSDEGVFGNYGWGDPANPLSPTPVGEACLLCFSRDGKKIWELPALSEFRMYDCYALNVWGGNVDAFLYDSFPIYRVSADFRTTYWTTHLEGCHQFAISDSDAVFSGQYGEPLEQGHFGKLRDGRLIETRPVRFALPNGAPIAGGQLLGRGPHLYFFDKRQVYRWSLG